MTLKKQAWAYAKRRYNMLDEGLQEDAAEDWMDGAHTKLNELLLIIDKLPPSMFTKEIVKKRIRTLLTK